MSLYNYKSIFNTKSPLYMDIFKAFLRYENCSQIKSGMVIKMSLSIIFGILLGCLLGELTFNLLHSYCTPKNTAATTHQTYVPY